ncbi:MAG TPA: isochorismatase family cysteine hydrolase [Actinomycetota bacterium]|jgi:nicotinamidase-related amidase|nr:isochorismatase family cysteine hydrolase [Actinomycetota bacterium]
MSLDIELHRTALVLLDLQNYGVHPDGYWMSQTPEAFDRVRPSLDRTVDVLGAARTAGIAIVHVANEWRDRHPDINPHAPWMASAREAGRSTQGTWGVEFYEPVAPQDGEFVVKKRAVSAFAGTELDRLLRVRDLSTLALTGTITNFAVEGTARDASDRGYRVVILEDCCETVSDEWQAFSMTQILPMIAEVVTTAEFTEALSHNT